MTWMGLLRWGLLWGAVLGSGLAVVYSKYQTRVLFTEIQYMEELLDAYEVEWGQLQLELTTLAEHNRIERRARTRLGLVLPEKDTVVYLKP